MICAAGELFMLKVYSYFNSICTQKVFITLAEKGLAYETQNVDLFKNEQFKPEYLKINPKGVVPALAGLRGERVERAPLVQVDEGHPAVALVREGDHRAEQLRAEAVVDQRAVHRVQVSHQAGHVVGIVAHQ